MISALSEYYSDANENWDDGIASGAWKQEVIRGDTGPVEETEFRIYWVILFNIYYFFFGIQKHIDIVMIKHANNSKAVGRRNLNTSVC